MLSKVGSLEKNELEIIMKKVIGNICKVEDFTVIKKPKFLEVTFNSFVLEDGRLIKNKEKFQVTDITIKDIYFEGDFLNDWVVEISKMK